MNTCRLVIDIEAVDAYLYGGYLHVFKADGSLGYIRFERLLGLCVDDRKDDFRDMKLAFLPYQTLKGSAYDFMTEYLQVRMALNAEIERAASGRVYTISQDTFEGSFHPFSSFDDMPLDVTIYGGEVFMGNSNGLFKCALNADESYKLHPDKLDKIFDGEAISLSSKCGMIAISSAQNGLFAYNLYSGINVGDKPVYEEYSVRSDWSVGDSLLNYRNNNTFSLLINRIGSVEERLNVPKRYMDDTIPKKSVEIFGEQKIKMEQLFRKAKSLENNISYMFSSISSGFFLTHTGKLEVRNLQENNDNIYYSSKTLFYKNISDTIKNDKPLSAKTFPGGCVIELYDKVLLLYKDEVEVLAEEPVFSVRTYMNSNSYRNLISIVYADRIEIIAVPMLPEKSRGAASYMPNP